MKRILSTQKLQAQVRAEGKSADDVSTKIFWSLGNGWNNIKQNPMVLSLLKPLAAPAPPQLTMINGVDMMTDMMTVNGVPIPFPTTVPDGSPVPGLDLSSLPQEGCVVQISSITQEQGQGGPNTQAYPAQGAKFDPTVLASFGNEQDFSNYTNTDSHLTANDMIDQ